MCKLPALFIDQQSREETYTAVVGAMGSNGYCRSSRRGGILESRYIDGVSERWCSKNLGWIWRYTEYRIPPSLLNLQEGSAWYKARLWTYCAIREGRDIHGGAIER